MNNKGHGHIVFMHKLAMAVAVHYDKNILRKDIVAKINNKGHNHIVHVHNLAKTFAVHFCKCIFIVTLIFVSLAVV